MKLDRQNQLKTDPLTLQRHAMLLLLDTLQKTHTLARALSKHVSKAFALLQCKISHWRTACTGVVCLPASNPQSYSAAVRHSCRIAWSPLERAMSA